MNKLNELSQFLETKISELQGLRKEPSSHLTIEEINFLSDFLYRVGQLSDFWANLDEQQHELATGIIAKLADSYNELEYYYSTTKGLYAVDKNPNEVSHEFIKENHFQL